MPEYTFPITEPGSVHFAFLNAPVEKAILSVDDKVLSVVCPAWSEDQLKNPDDVSVPLTELVFFGSADGVGSIPFHSGLTQGRRVVIKLITMGTRTPSLAMTAAKTSLTWSQISGSVYHERVVAQSESGPRTRTLAYMLTGCGYIRE